MTARVLAVSNGEAGSAGKTTTAVTLATFLALDGYRVVIKDLDPQASATFALRGHTAPGTTGDVLLRRVEIAQALQQTAVEGLYLLAATSDLAGDALELQKATGGEQRLRRAIAELDDIDYVVLDCAGALGILTIAALVAADEVIATTMPGIKEMKGLPLLASTVKDVQEAYRPDLKFDVVVPCSVPPKQGGLIYQESLDLLNRTWARQVTRPVRRSSRVVEAFAEQTPLPVYAPDDPVTHDYKGVYLDIRDKGVLAA